jgi:hypothetical protein
MSTPIQFIREQIKDAAIDPSKIDVSDGSFNYDFSSVILNTATQAQEDNSTKAASTAYVDAAVVGADIDAGAGILSTGSGPEVFSVDITLGASGLTFSATGDSGKLLAAVGPTAGTAHGLELAADGYLGIKTATANGLELTAQGLLAIDLADTSLELGANGLSAKLQGAFFTVEASGIKVADGAINTVQLADDSVTSVKIDDGAVLNAKLGANSVTNSKIGNDAVGIENMAMESKYEEFAANGATLAFTVATAKIEYPEMAQVYKNGQRMSYVTSSPGADEYTIATNVITFGANVTSGAVVQVSYFFTGTVV